MVVICPAFVTDCLETLEEIAIQGQETFLEAGGHSLKLAPCLNLHPDWVDMIVDWCSQIPVMQDTATNKGETLS